MKTLLFTLLCSLFSLYSFAQVASYSFNNGNANDEVGSNDGSVYGAAPTADRFGNLNHAYYFDGEDDYINFGDSTAFQMGLDEFSISLWVKTDSIVPKGCILGKTSSDVNLNYNQYSIWYNNNGELFNTNCRDDGTGVSITTSSANIDSFAWNHIVLRYGDYDGTSYATILYLNNIGVDTSITLPGGSLDIPGIPLVIGRRNNAADFHFNGHIDDLQIYKRAISPQEIDSLYNAPNPVTSDVSAIPQTALQLFPNPTQNRLNIQHPTEAFNRVEVIAIDGRVQNIKLSLGKQQEIDLADLQAGLYVLRIWREGELLAVQKFSKM